MARRVVVVGAGAGGIIASWRAAQCGAKVVLLEKTSRVGTKILISGGGKCNITHDGELEGVLKAFRPNEARFIRPACYRFKPADIVKMLTDRGLKVYTRPDGRIFPVDQTAKDVVAILRAIVEEVGVEIRLDTPVTDVVASGQNLKAFETADGRVEFDTAVITVGGSSYPASGTTGDGFAWAKKLGHTVVKVRGALAPINLQEEFVRPDWSGVAIRDCVLKGRQNGKEFVRWRGDLLFTHRGISGPNTLGISREVAEKAGLGPITLEVDFLPDLKFESLSAKLDEFARSNPKRLWPGWVNEIMPEAVVEQILKTAGIEGPLSCANTPKKMRNKLIEALKGWQIGVVKDVPIEKGEVVAGGISLEEVDPKTMRSSLIDNLYLAGEVLDIAGPVGGYNLQAAFATGFVAGESAAVG